MRREVPWHIGMSSASGSEGPGQTSKNINNQLSELDTFGKRLAGKKGN